MQLKQFLIFLLTAACSYTHNVFAQSCTLCSEQYTLASSFGSATGNIGPGAGQITTDDINIVHDNTGNIYVLNNSHVIKFSSSGSFITQWGDYGSGDGYFDTPKGIAIDASNNIYVTDAARVQKFNSNGTFLWKWGNWGNDNSQFMTAGDIAVGPTGNVYVIDIYNYRVQIFNGGGDYISQFGSYGTNPGQFTLLQSITVDASGNIWIADNNYINKYSSSGVYLNRWGGPGSGNAQFSGKTTLTADGSGNIYVADAGNNRIQKITSSGVLITQWGNTGNSPIVSGMIPSDIIMGSDCDLYLADRGNAMIQHFAPLIGVLPPTITSLNPTSGTAGTTVILHGTHMLGLNSVKYNGVVTSYQIMDDNTVKALIPAGATTGTFAVKTAYCPTVTSSNFTIVCSTVSSISPTTGVAGKTVTITGNYMLGVTAVKFNGVSTTFQILDVNTITAVVPSNAAAGAFTFTLYNSNCSVVTPSYTVVCPTITSMSPVTGFAGASVTLTGTNFTAVTALKYNGLAVTYSILNNNTITTSIPANAIAGAGMFTISTPACTNISSPTFTVVCPMITSLSPTTGLTGTPVTLTGTNLNGTTSVKYNGNTVPYSIVNNTTITTTIPAGGITGTFTVNTSSCTSTSPTFTVICPTLTNMTPTTGVVGATVTFTGTHLSTVAAIKYYSTQTTFQIIDDNTVTTVVPPGYAAGNGNFVLSVGGDCPVLTSPNFTTVCPILLSMSPSTGSYGTTVTLTGNNLTAVTSISFNGVSAAYTIVNSTTITAVIPHGVTSGTFSLNNNNPPFCPSQTSPTFTVACPVITSMNPTTGHIGTKVTLTGSHMLDVTNVLYNGSLVLYEINDDNTISAVIPVSATNGTFTLNSLSCGNVASPTLTIQTDPVCPTDVNHLYSLTNSWSSYGSGNGQLNWPRDLEQDAAGNFYVVDEKNSRVQKFSSNGTYLLQFGTQTPGKLNMPTGITIDENGYVYVTDEALHSIFKYTSTGTYVTQWGKAGGVAGTGNGEFNQPKDIDVDGLGYLYVTDQMNQRIQKFTSTGVYISQWGKAGNQPGYGNGEFYNPWGITVDASGNVYVADYTNQRIQKLDHNGTYIAQWPCIGGISGTIDAPLAIDVDRNGNLYVTNIDKERILTFNNTGTPLSEFTIPNAIPGLPAAYSEGILIDASCKIYATINSYDPGTNTANYYIGIFTPSGYRIASTGSSFTNTTTNSDQELNVYPNPAIDILNITTTIETYRIEITDTYGKMVHSSVNAQTIDLRSLSEGMYYITLITDDKCISKKFVHIR